MNETEFFCILKPSPLGGIGVFAARNIPTGTLLFKYPAGHIVRTMKIKDIPEPFIQYCVYINNEEAWCPERFDRMEMGWYINHSNTPNIAAKKELHISNNNVIKPSIYTIKDIKAGEEILIDYNYLGEPDSLKEDFYK